MIGFVGENNMEPGAFKADIESPSTRKKGDGTHRDAPLF